MCTANIESQKMFHVATSLSCSVLAIFAFCWPTTQTPSITKPSRYCSNKASYSNFSPEIGCHGDDHRVSLYFTMGRPFHPQNCPFPLGIWVPHPIHGTLGPPKSSTQIASSSVQPFLQGSLVWQTDIPRDHATRSVTTGHIYIRSTAMRPNNNNDCTSTAIKSSNALSGMVMEIIPIPIHFTKITELLLSLPDTHQVCFLATHRWPVSWDIVQTAIHSECNSMSILIRNKPKPKTMPW